MGACYHVVCRVKFRDKEGATNALKQFIQNTSKKYSYNLGEFAKLGIGTETFDDLMRIFLAGYKNQEVEIREDVFGLRVYRNSFNASYGWEMVLIDMFYALSPYLEDESMLKIYPDSSCDLFVMENGECVRIK